MAIVRQHKGDQTRYYNTETKQVVEPRDEAHRKSLEMAHQVGLKMKGGATREEAVRQVRDETEPKHAFREDPEPERMMEGLGAGAWYGVGGMAALPETVGGLYHYGAAKLAEQNPERDPGKIQAAKEHRIKAAEWMEGAKETQAYFADDEALGRSPTWATIGSAIGGARLPKPGAAGRVAQEPTRRLKAARLVKEGFGEGALVQGGRKAKAAHKAKYTHKAALKAKGQAKRAWNKAAGTQREKLKELDDAYAELAYRKDKMEKASRVPPEQPPAPSQTKREFLDAEEEVIRQRFAQQRAEGERKVTKAIGDLEAQGRSAAEHARFQDQRGFERAHQSFVNRMQEIEKSSRTPEQAAAAAEEAERVYRLAVHAAKQDQIERSLKAAPAIARKEGAAELAEQAAKGQEPYTRAVRDRDLLGIRLKREELDAPAPKAEQPDWKHEELKLQKEKSSLDARWKDLYLQRARAGRQVAADELLRRDSARTMERILEASGGGASVAMGGRGMTGMWTGKIAAGLADAGKRAAAGVIHRATQLYQLGHLAGTEYGGHTLQDLILKELANDPEAQKELMEYSGGE